MDPREEIAIMVANEGLGYFITSYASEGMMPDAELKAAFKKAKEALKAFEALLPDVDM